MRSCRPFAAHDLVSHLRSKLLVLQLPQLMLTFQTALPTALFPPKSTCSDAHDACSMSQEATASSTSILERSAADSSCSNVYICASRSAASSLPQINDLSPHSSSVTDCPSSYLIVSFSFSYSTPDRSPHAYLTYLWTVLTFSRDFHMFP